MIISVYEIIWNILGQINHINYLECSNYSLGTITQVVLVFQYTQLLMTIILTALELVALTTSTASGLLRAAFMGVA